MSTATRTNGSFVAAILAPIPEESVEEDNITLDGDFVPMDDDDNDADSDADSDADGTTHSWLRHDTPEVLRARFATMSNAGIAALVRDARAVYAAVNAQVKSSRAYARRDAEAVAEVEAAKALHQSACECAAARGIATV